MSRPLCVAALTIVLLGCGGDSPTDVPTTRWVSFGGKFFAESFNGRALPTQIGLHFCDDTTLVPLMFESGWIEFRNDAPVGKRSTVEISSETSWVCPSGPGSRSPSPTTQYLATPDSVLFISINMWAPRNPLRPTFNFADSTGVILYR